MDFEDPQLTEMEKRTNEQRSPWLGRVGLVLLSSALSSLISVCTVSLGWKASIDTINAVSQVRIANNEAAIKRLDDETVKTPELTYRDQLEEVKFSTVDIELGTIRDQIGLNTRKGGR